MAPRVGLQFLEESDIAELERLELLQWNALNQHAQRAIVSSNAPVVIRHLWAANQAKGTIESLIKIEKQI